LKNNMIIPAILVNTFSDFEQQAKKLSFAPLVQIDVMDGEFVPNKSFAEFEKINDLNLPIKWELHLMVNRPLKEIIKWQKIKNIQRVIFHIESEDNPNDVISVIKDNRWEVGIAINPETEIKEILPFLIQIDEVLFLTVHPGKQGALFVPEVKNKILELRKVLENKDMDMIVAVDGAVKIDNITEIKSWGVNNFCIGGTITLASDPQNIYEQFNNLV